MSNNAFILCGLFLAAATPAAAKTPKWAVAFNAGVDLSPSGDVHGSGNGRVPTRPTAVESRSYGDIYGHPFTWSVDFGIDLRWHGDLNPIDGLGGTGLESLNDETRRWSAPVTAGVVLRF